MTIQHSDEMRRCTRCVLPANFRNIRFDRNGVCNYCHNHDRLIERFRRFSLAEEVFLKQIQANKGKYPYDCAVGLSGGKDSAYVIYQLVRKYGLKPLAFTFDNRWQDERAKQIITKIVNELGVDHVVLDFEKQQHYRLYAASTRQFGWPCIACSFLGIVRVQRYCFDRRIPLIVHGRARNQMLRELSKYSHDTYLPFYGLNYKACSFEELMGTVKSAHEKIDLLLKRIIPDQSERDRFASQYAIDPAACERERFVPQFVAYFLMEDYNEQKTVEFMEKTVLGNQKLHKPSHSDCFASDAFMYIYKQAFGWSLLELEIAFDVRDGKISREMALEKIRSEKPAHSVPEEDLDRVCQTMNVSRQDLLDGLQIARRNIRAYTRLKRVKDFFKPEFQV